VLGYREGSNLVDLVEGRPKHRSFVAKYEGGGERRVDLLEFLAITRAIGADPARLLKATHEPSCLALARPASSLVLGAPFPSYEHEVTCALCSIRVTAHMLAPSPSAKSLTAAEYQCRTGRKCCSPKIRSDGELRFGC
jgi:hypothetical protein